jgi:hypothetical protein
MSIPLVQNNEKDSINTSIIAIKRNIERINMLLGLSNSEEIDTSKFATKEELQQAVTDLQPVDVVAIDNMQSVTSNAVAKAIQLKSVTGVLSIADGSSFNLDFPENYQYLVVVVSTPYFAFTDVIPKAYLDITNQFVSYHTTYQGFQIVEYVLYKNGTINISRVRQNNIANTGNMYVYYVN